MHKFYKNAAWRFETQRIVTNYTSDSNQWIDIEKKEKSTMAILTNHENEKPRSKCIKIEWYLNDIESRKIENRQEILIQNK